MNYKKKKNLDSHMNWDNYIPSQLILLWETDTHVDQSGEDVGYKN